VNIQGLTYYSNHTKLICSFVFLFLNVVKYVCVIGFGLLLYGTFEFYPTNTPHVFLWCSVS